jgi:hypothetical protein
MPGDEQNTKVPLRDYVEAKFEAIATAQAAFAKELDRRLEGMNEFRAQLTKQATQFITREAVEAKLTALVTERNALIEKLELRLEMAARGKVSWGVAVAVTVLVSLVVGLVVAIASRVMT